MFTFSNKTRRSQLIYNLKRYKTFVVYLTVLIILVLALRQFASGGGAGPARRQRDDDDAALSDVTLNDTQAELLRNKLQVLNDAQSDLNTWQGFGPVRRDTTLVVVQVHRDLAALRRLVATLARARGIHTALLIFSHSHYDEAVNELVRGITFCRVMQIYYPHSPQLHPSGFPGVDPGDCGAAAAGGGCEPRDAGRTLHKQHWWWKAHFVFSQPEWSAVHGGMVLFLEERDRVAPDALHVLRYAQRALASHPEALLVSLGRARAAAGDQYGLLALDEWRPPYDVGLALNRSAWRRIAALTGRFCMFDDTSWSYSLLHAFRALPAGAAEALVAVAPRVASLPARAADAWEARLRTAPLFPEQVRCVAVWGRGGRVRRAGRAAREVRGAGGWADLRDQVLCLYPLLNSKTETAVEDTFTVMPHYRVAS